MSRLLPTFRLQRRFSFVLAAALCLWILAAATHFHTPLDDLGAHHTGKELCGFCASLPAGAAAPAVSTFVSTAQRWHFLAPAKLVPLLYAISTASYRSRAPPAL
jgi:hypothetical protein